MTGARRPSRFEVRPIGVISSELTSLADAPMQGSEGAPDAWPEVEAPFTGAIDGTRLHVGPLEAIDGTPVVDIKPVLK